MLALMRKRLKRMWDGPERSTLMFETLERSRYAVVAAIGLFGIGQIVALSGLFVAGLLVANIGITMMLAGSTVGASVLIKMLIPTR